jgi:hypothetical protein
MGPRLARHHSWNGVAASRRPGTARSLLIQASISERALGETELASFLEAIESAGQAPELPVCRLW